jgi:hypothetical protein
MPKTNIHGTRCFGVMVVFLVHLLFGSYTPCGDNAKRVHQLCALNIYVCYRSLKIIT